MTKNFVQTAYTGGSGILASQYPFIPENAYDFDGIKSCKVYTPRKLPKLPYTIKEEPGVANIYISIDASLSGWESDKLYNKAVEILEKEGLKIDDKVFNFVIDLETETVFSYGGKTKQKIGTNWEPFLTELSLECVDLLPKSSYVLLILNNHILCNNMRYAKDFLFLLTLKVLDDLFDVTLSRNPEVYETAQEYSQPSDAMFFFTFLFVKRLLTKMNLDVECGLETYDISSSIKAFSKIIPIYPTNAITSEAEQIPILFSIPNYLTKLINKDQQPGKQLALLPISLSSFLERGLKGFSGTDTDVKFDLISGLIPENDIVRSFVKISKASLNIYIIVKDYLYQGKDEEERVEAIIETQAKLHLKDPDAIQMYVYILHNSDYILDFGLRGNNHV